MGRSLLLRSSVLSYFLICLICVSWHLSLICVFSFACAAHCFQPKLLTALAEASGEGAEGEPAPAESVAGEPE